MARLTFDIAYKTIRKLPMGLFCLVAFVVHSASAQVLDTVLTRFARYNRSVFQEKLYVHTDRSFYITGETLWFKVYDVDATLHAPAALSHVAYLEILDRDNKPVLQTKIGLAKGSGNGTFFIPTTLASGKYVLRAYTQWMRNFSSDFYYHQSIVIVNPFGDSWRQQTAEKLAYDVQFFPEGGHLVSQVSNTVAVRAVDQNGVGIDFRGVVVDERNDTAVRFQLLKTGIGSFSLTPSGGRTYRAVLQDRNGKAWLSPFPKSEPEGFVLHLKDSSGKLIVEVSSRFDKPDRTGTFVYVLAHTRRSVGLAERLPLRDGRATLVFDKNKLGVGVSHVTLFNESLIPVCERLYFRPPAEINSVVVQSDQEAYDTRRKIALTIKATKGEAEALDLSVAVFKKDSLYERIHPIDTYLLLTSELKGTVTNPDFYMTAAGSPFADDLMLTQGWTRFSWKAILANEKPDSSWLPEINGHIIRGKVTNVATGLPAPRTIAYLSTPAKNIHLYLSRSDDEGNVRFEMQDFVGSRRLVAQTNYVLDSNLRVNLVSPFSEEFSRFPLSPLRIGESFRNALTQRSVQMQVQNAFYGENPNTIETPTYDTIPFYGKPDEQYLLDDFTRFPTMEEVMREYVPGVFVRKRRGKFHFLTPDRPNRTVFQIDPLVLLDGVPIFDVDQIMAFDPRKIRKLDVITQKYFLGPLSFDGLVSYTTYQGDLADFQLVASALVTNYQGVQWTREFFTPRYDARTETSHTPDMRSLLFWSPKSKFQNGEWKVEFYSSDVSGRFSIVVEGISRNGTPVSTSSEFEVRNSDNH